MAFDMDIDIVIYTKIRRMMVKMGLYFNICSEDISNVSLYAHR
jgi:hypothetical protein